MHRLSEAKYRTWEWNYGLSPRFNAQRVKRFAIGEIDARLDVEEGVIRGVRFFGDGIRTTSLVMQTHPHRIRFIDSIHVQPGKDGSAKIRF